MTEPRVVTVTPAQRRVIGELARDGATNAEIGERLYVTEDTVKTHMRRALRRCGCDNRTALVVDLLRGRLLLHTDDGRDWRAGAQAVDGAADKP